ncbi:YdcF family protein [Hyphomonas sp.]
MFIVSKVVGFLLTPSNLIGLIGLFGVLLVVVNRRRPGCVVLFSAAVLLAISGWSPAGPLLLRALEERFPQAQIDNRPVAGIILLGGAVNTHIAADRGMPAMNDAAERVTAIAELSRRFPEARLLLSGGASDITQDETMTESDVARDVLVDIGVDPRRIEMETVSRNTCENAEQSRRVAKPNSGELWLLVTSASHMPRAVGCFRAAGFPVLPYPVDFRSRSADGFRLAGSVTTGLQALDLAAHEWIGLASYRLLGRTDALFPAP